MKRFIAYLPTFRPVGGVIKVLDYAVHADSMGFDEVVVCCPESYEGSLPVFQIDRFGDRSEDWRFVHGFSVGVGPADIALFSWPRHYEEIAVRMGPNTAHERAIHLIQNIRHANASWDGGYPRRLLARPMARVFTTSLVEDSVRQHVHRDSLSAVVTLGHDTAFFATERSTPPERPLRVLTTTWKSRTGAEVADHLDGDPRFEFRVIDKAMGWPELRTQYAESDVFLGCPIAEEGFYLPALEAMAARAIVLVPNAGGNMAFCRFDENCLEVGLDDSASYVNALESVAAMTGDHLMALQDAGATTATQFSLHGERSGFEAFVARIDTEARPRSSD